MQGGNDNHEYIKPRIVIKPAVECYIASPKSPDCGDGRDNAFEKGESQIFIENIEKDRNEIDSPKREQHWDEPLRIHRLCHGFRAGRYGIYLCGPEKPESSGKNKYEPAKIPTHLKFEGIGGSDDG